MAKKSLEDRIQRLEDLKDIENLMAAMKIFNYHTYNEDLRWAESAWRIIEKTYLSHYSDAQEFYFVIIRLFAIGELFYIYIDLACDETYEPYEKYIDWVEELELDKFQLTRLAGENGLITLIHCEDYSIIEEATDRLERDGKISFRYYPESRPVISEVVATQKAVAFAEITGSPVYIVHLSSRRALEVCVEAQNRKVPVYVETRPLYLHLTAERFEDVDGAKYVGQPPLREQQDVDALWIGLSQDLVHTVCTDHAPWSLAAKLDPAHTITNLRPGVENLQTMLPMLYSEGVRSSRITLGRFVELTSTNAAKLFGLFPKKGTIAVGSDADLVVFDPNQTLTVNKSMLKSNADYSPYEGYRVTGWPVLTLRRGEIVFRDGHVIGQPGSGIIVPRGMTAPI